MYTFNVSSQLNPFSVPLGPRARELIRFFGITRDAMDRKALYCRLSLTLYPGWICCITGPSGAGKSILLNALCGQTPPDERIRIENIPLESTHSVIDCIDSPPAQSLPILTRAGLSDVWCLLQSPTSLSEGQKWRYRLAKALMTPAKFLFADEFCAALDTTTALVIACQLRRTIRRTGRILILAGCREDVLAELQPDVLVTVSSLACIRVLYADAKKAPTSPQNRSVASQ